MQEAGGDEAPPLAGQDRVAVLGAEQEERLPGNRHRITFEDAHAMESRGEVKAEVDQQDHHGGEPGVRDQASQDLAGLPAPDAGWADVMLTIRTNAVGG